MVADWRDWGECRTHPPELFFPTDSDDIGQKFAVEICQGCVVIDRCHNEAEQAERPYGVWGGKFYNGHSRRVRAQRAVTLDNH